MAALLAGIGRHLALELLLAVQSARLALVALGPAVAELLDAKALVVGVVAGEMAVGLQAEGVVAAGEEKFLEIAHIEGVLGVTEVSAAVFETMG